MKDFGSWDDFGNKSKQLFITFFQANFVWLVKDFGITLGLEMNCERLWDDFLMILKILNTKQFFLSFFQANCKWE